jgi:hypothetical protein
MSNVNAESSDVTIKIGRDVAAKLPATVLNELQAAARALEERLSSPTQSMVCQEVFITQCAVFMACKGFSE